MSNKDNVPAGAATPLGLVNVQADYGAAGDGRTDDRVAIKNALAAVASLGGGAVVFPPGEYMVSQEPSQPFCLDMPGSNIQLWGVKGCSWIKALPGLTAATVILRIDQRVNVTIRDLSLDGNWGNAKTEIAAASHNVELPTGTIHVTDTGAFPASGSIVVIASDGTAQPVGYTGVTSASFTGCSGGAGTLSTGSAVGYVDDKTGINHTTQIDPKSHGIMIRGARDIVISNCLIRQCYGDGIWIGPSSADISKPASNVRISNTDIDMSARSGIAVGGVAEDLYVGRCRFTSIFAQAFDTEPVGSRGYARDVTIEKVFLGGWWNPANPARGANSPLSIQGGVAGMPNESNRARQYRVRDCSIMGSVLISDAVDVVFEHNRVVCDFPGHSFAPILVEMDCDDVWILDNYIYDRTTAQAGNTHDAAISMQVYSAGSLNQQPAGVHVRGNRIHARRGRHGIKVEGTGVFALGTGPQMASESGMATGIEGVATSVTDLSNAQTLPVATINVASTAGFLHSGTITIVTHAQTELITYTGKTSTTFTGCSGGKSQLHTGDAVSACSLTDSSKSWTPDQWRGKVVRIAGVQGTVLSSTLTELVLDGGGWRTMLGNPVDPAVTPGTGSYSIYGSSALVDIENNTIECTDDGFGQGGYGIYLVASRSGMRVRCHKNQIINASGDAIRVVTVDAARKILYLEITENVAVDTQPTATCRQLLNFTNIAGNPLDPYVQKWIMRGNEPGICADGNQMPTYAGLTPPAAWTVSDGTPAAWAGYGSPEALITSSTGSTYLRLDGGPSTTLYLKDSGSGNTGWVTVTTKPTPAAWADQLHLAGGNFDPVVLGDTNLTITSGVVFLFKTRVYSATFSTVLFQVGVAEVGAAHCYIGIYKADGTQTAVMAAATTDALSSVASTGLKTIILANPVNVPAGDDVYVAVLISGSPTTGLQLRASTGNAAINGNLNASQGLRSGASGSALIALPPAITLSGMSAVVAMAWTGLQ